MIKVIDLFAGIGGIRLGFEQAFKDVHCVFTSEIDKFAVQTYQANFGDEVVHGDITKIATQDIPSHDILLAGFPCQPFSQAGLKKVLTILVAHCFLILSAFYLKNVQKLFCLKMLNS